MENPYCSCELARRPLSPPDRGDPGRGQRPAGQRGGGPGRRRRVEYRESIPMDNPYCSCKLTRCNCRSDIADAMAAGVPGGTLATAANTDYISPPRMPQVTAAALQLQPLRRTSCCSCKLTLPLWRTPTAAVSRHVFGCRAGPRGAVRPGGHGLRAPVRPTAAVPVENPCCSCKLTCCNCRYGWGAGATNFQARKALF